jgi:hypothetical protein
MSEVKDLNSLSVDELRKLLTDFDAFDKYVTLDQQSLNDVKSQQEKCSKKASLIFSLKTLYLRIHSYRRVRNN